MHPEGIARAYAEAIMIKDPSIKQVFTHVLPHPSFARSGFIPFNCGDIYNMRWRGEGVLTAPQGKASPEERDKGLVFNGDICAPADFHKCMVVHTLCAVKEGAAAYLILHKDKVEEGKDLQLDADMKLKKLTISIRGENNRRPEGTVKLEPISGFGFEVGFRKDRATSIPKASVSKTGNSIAFLIQEGKNVVGHEVPFPLLAGAGCVSESVLAVEALFDFLWLLADRVKAQRYPKRARSVGGTSMTELNASWSTFCDALLFPVDSEVVKHGVLLFVDAVFGGMIPASFGVDGEDVAAMLTETSVLPDDMHFAPNYFEAVDSEEHRDHVKACLSVASNVRGGCLDGLSMLYCTLFRVVNSQEPAMLAAGKTVFMQTLKGGTTYDDDGRVYLGDEEIMQVQFADKDSDVGSIMLYHAARGKIPSDSKTEKDAGVASLTVHRTFEDFETFIVTWYTNLIPCIWNVMLPCHKAVPPAKGCLAGYGLAVLATVIAFACQSEATVPSFGITKDVLRCKGKLNEIMLSSGFGASLQGRRVFLRQVAAYLTQMDMVHPETGLSLDNTVGDTSSVRLVQYVVTVLQAMNACHPFLTAEAVRVIMMKRQDMIVSPTHGWSNPNDPFLSYVVEGGAKLFEVSIALPKNKDERPAAKMVFLRTHHCDSTFTCAEFCYTLCKFYDMCGKFLRQWKSITIAQLKKLKSGKGYGNIPGFDQTLLWFRRDTNNLPVFNYVAAGFVPVVYMLELALISAKMNFKGAGMSTIRITADLHAEQETPPPVETADEEYNLDLSVPGSQLLPSLTLDDFDPVGTDDFIPLLHFTDEDAALAEALLSLDPPTNGNETFEPLPNLDEFF